MTTSHVVAEAVHHLHDALDEAHDVSVLSLTAAATRETLVDLSRVQARVAELEARLLMHAEAVKAHEVDQSASVKQWWARATRHATGTGARHVLLAQGLVAYPELAAAMARGEVVEEQAMVILRAVGDLSSEHRAAGLEEMLTQAKAFDAKALRIIGRKLFEVLDPEKAEAQEQAKLDDEERKAALHTQFSIWLNGDGFYEGRFSLPVLQGAKLKKALMLLAAPAHVRAREGAGAYEFTRPSAQRLGEAFCAFIDDQCDTDLVVTIDLATLAGAARKAGWAETDDHASATAVRQWACEAGIIPVVLGADGRVLDVGRKRRFHTKAQRLALLAERQTCEIGSCGMPAYLCHVHHEVPWSEGGKTNLRDARVVCPKHHRDLHQHPDRVPNWRPMRT